MANRGAALIGSGKLQSQEGVINLIVDRFEDLTGRLPELGNRSRVFR